MIKREAIPIDKRNHLQLLDFEIIIEKELEKKVLNILSSFNYHNNIFVEKFFLGEERGYNQYNCKNIKYSSVLALYNCLVCSEYCSDFDIFDLYEHIRLTLFNRKIIDNTVRPTISEYKLVSIIKF